MKELILKANADWVALILRLTAGLIMLPHGLQKTIGWFGGYGFKPTMDYFTQVMKLPWLLAFLVIITESFGALCLLSGLFSKVWAITLILVMIGAIITTNFKHGLFMNWSGSQSGEGFEYHLLFIGICLCILLTGSGKFSVDSFLNSIFGQQGISFRS